MNKSGSHRLASVTESVHGTSVKSGVNSLIFCTPRSLGEGQS